MSQHQIETIKRYYDAFNRHDHTIYERVFTADCVIRAPGVEMSSIDAMRGFDKVWQDALPDAKLQIVTIAVTGEHVLCCNRITGHHTGALVMPTGTLPASGNRFDEEYFVKFTFAGERIKLQQLMFDRVRVMEALK